MVMKKIKLTESDLYRIVKQVLLEQEEEKRSFTFSPGSFASFITSSSGERFVKHLNNKHDKIIVNGYLDLEGTPIQSLPDNLNVKGDLYLNGCENLKSLPDNLHVGGSLRSIDTPIQSLGNNLYVKGALDLEGTPIQSLPDNLRVGGYLDLNGCENLKSLPDNLYVGGYLDLSFTQIQSLPNNLYVVGGLVLKYTPIQSLPDNLRVGGLITLRNTNLLRNKELIKKYKNKYRLIINEINSYSPYVSDKVFKKIIDEIDSPENVVVDVGLLGISVRQSGYGTWTLIGEFRIDGNKKFLYSKTHNEELVLASRGENYREFDYTQEEADEHIVYQIVNDNVDEFLIEPKEDVDDE
jgi:hypothetical protein